METLEERYKQAMAKPLQVLEIFNNFFGDARVDMQGFPTYEAVATALSQDASVQMVYAYLMNRPRESTFILVHFPHVKVTNEYDKSVEINHLYAKIPIDANGRLVNGFYLNRAEYTLLHMMNNYMHSHVSSIPFNDFTCFQHPCTGTGPINSTIYSLTNAFDEDIWNLFCLELDKYVQVESVAGTPYHRLESLRPGGSNAIIACVNLTLTNNFRYTYCFPYKDLAAFIKYIIDKDVLKFNYRNNAYYLAMPPTEFYIRISNTFTEWYNKNYPTLGLPHTMQDLFREGILNRYTFSGGHLYSPGRNTPTYYMQYQGCYMCTFKGQEVHISITDLPSGEALEENQVIILKEDIANYILSKILNVINFRYGNNRNNTEGSTSERVIYL